MRDNEISLLLIEEDLEKVSLYRNLLKKGGLHTSTYEITTAHALEPALALLSNHTYDIILSTLFLPDSGGIETYRRLRKNAPNTPVIILSRPIDEELALETIVEGAQGYLPKTEVTANTLNRIIFSSLERHALRSSLRALSFTDEMTSLYNRRGFTALAQQQIDLSQREKKGFYLFLIDLDLLKDINDAFGHRAGDEALIGAARSIKKTFRSSDIVARIGGDEFAVIAIHVPPEKGMMLKEHLHENIQAYNATKKQPFVLSVSVGMVYYEPTHLPTLEQLMTRADAELYEEKHLKHNNHKK